MTAFSNINTHARLLPLHLCKFSGTIHNPYHPKKIITTKNKTITTEKYIEWWFEFEWIWLDLWQHDVAAQKPIFEPPTRRGGSEFTWVRSIQIRTDVRFSVEKRKTICSQSEGFLMEESMNQQLWLAASRCTFWS